VIGRISKPTAKDILFLYVGVAVPIGSLKGGISTLTSIDVRMTHGFKSRHHRLTAITMAFVLLSIAIPRSSPADDGQAVRLPTGVWLEPAAFLGLAFSNPKTEGDMVIGRLVLRRFRKEGISPIRPFEVGAIAMHINKR
jgi:hypothetical protein